HQACDIKPPVITRRPPFGLEGRTDTGGGIILSWEEPLYITETITHYNIYRKTTYSDYELVGTSPTLSFVDEGIEELTYYNYAVSATYDAGESSSAKLSIYSGIFGGWARNWGGAGEQTAYDVAPAPDLGCIAVGFSRYSMYHDSDVYIVRSVPGGSRLWSRLYGGDGDDFAYSVILDSDSNYVVVGETEDLATGDFNIWLLKLDDEGDTLWTATYGTSQRDAGMSVKETSDGGYIIAGSTGDTGSEQAYFVKTDRDGILQWSRTYSNATVAKDIAVVSSGGYIATGYTSDGPLGRKDFYLIRLDDSGDSLWAKNSGGAFDDVGNSIIETGGDGFLIAGNSYSYGIPVFSGIHLRKVDSSGDSTWAANYTAMSNYTANSVAHLQSGGYIVAGSAEISSNIDFFILALDEDGDSLWARLYGTLGTDIAYSALQLPDTGVVTAGVTFMDGSTDFWIMKFGGDVTTHVSEDARQIPASFSITTYPNPFNSAVSIVTAPNADISIYDLKGHRVAEMTGDKSGKSVWVPSPETPAGIYLISTSIGGKRITARTAFIK
ncbi:MAG TPA: T9SS type A sorting domain-containing protein, partial [candidate division Zixibacteria bacterium]|nr:T9SS type A sorting domain-containing protein [candidate division Zixibacteria bacterium]